MGTNTVPGHLDLTVRVGCSLVYEVTGTASVLLNVKPCEDSRHHVIAEAMTLGDNLPSDEFTDSHGNAYSRVALAPGSNYFRHDAIVAVSSKPDDQGIEIPAPQEPDKLPLQLLRYTLPSRYCDSDKLVNFA